MTSTRSFLSLLTAATLPQVSTCKDTPSYIILLCGVGKRSNFDRAKKKCFFTKHFFSLMIHCAFLNYINNTAETGTNCNNCNLLIFPSPHLVITFCVNCTHIIHRLLFLTKASSFVSQTRITTPTATLFNVHCLPKRV